VTYNFGNSIVREFYCLQDNEYINLPSQVPAIYLFSNYPSLTAARNGTGATATLDYWTHSNTSPFKRQFTFSAVADPEPTSETRSRGYWEVINFVLQGSGDTQTVIRELELERPEALESVPSTVYSDCTQIFPHISSYLTQSQVEAYISLAEDHFKLDLKKRGLDWGRVYRLKEIRIPIAYKTLALALRGQLLRDPALTDVVEYFDNEYNLKIAGIQLPYDPDNDGTAEQSVTAEPAYARITR
jgi:hypothetical protein